MPPLRMEKLDTPVTETKASQLRKTKKKGLEFQNMEIDKTIGSFNLENEINKIKIPIHLVELADVT
jgi:hypothetical protein